jgi:hypothetical protein
VVLFRQQSRGLSDAPQDLLAEIELVVLFLPAYGLRRQEPRLANWIPALARMTDCEFRLLALSGDLPSAVVPSCWRAPSPHRAVSSPDRPRERVCWLSHSTPALSFRVALCDSALTGATERPLSRIRLPSASDPGLRMRISQGHFF